jgi:hypothetical protein
MVYTPTTNWKYDKSLYHAIQSGPQRTGDNLDRTDTYLTFSSGYVMPNGVQQTYESVSSEGADFGVIRVGPPNISGYFNTEWRAVPPAISGYWTNYDNVNPHASGLLDSYVGFRAQGLYKTANSTVQTAIGPQPGLRNFGSFTWYGEQVPDNQLYSPFQTPRSNDNSSEGGGITGGGVTQPRLRAPALTNPTNDTTGSRAAWVYHYPIYCQSLVETRYSSAPGQMGSPTRNSYRGKSSRYVPNYGSIYGKLGEGVRNMVRTFSPGVNSSNQKGI